MFGRGDDDGNPNCSRNNGGWGPNFCECTACSYERGEQEKKSKASDEYYRSKGFDPHENGMPLMIFISDSDLIRLNRIAKDLDMEPDLCAANLLSDVIREYSDI